MANNCKQCFNALCTISPTATPLPTAYDCVAVYIAGRRTNLVVYGWQPKNKANLRDLIALTGLVLSLKIGFKSLIYGPMWPGNRMAAPLYYVKLCASFQSHRWIQTGVTVRKRSIWVKIGDFFFPCDLKIWRMTLRNNRHIFSTTSSFVLHFIAIYQFKMELQSGNTKFGSKSAIFVPCDLEIWRMTLKNNRAPFLCYFKLSVSFHSHSKFSITNKDLKPKKMF